MLNLARTVPLTAALVLAAAAAPVSASAFVASSGPEGLNLDDANGERAEVALALVTGADGATRYRVEVPRPAIGQERMTVAVGCVKESDDVALCDRVAPQVKVTLGGQADTFTVDPAFPDPITMSAGGGKDVLRLGAGNDVVTGAADTVFGEGGDDTMTAFAGGGIGFAELHGGPGNDTMTVANGFSTLHGDDGDDTLAVEQSDVAFTGGNLIGGGGTDTFRLNGRGSIDSRDGIAETVLCSNRRGAGRFQDSDRAIIDLADTLDPSLPAGGCHSVDRAPREERTSIRLVSKKLQVDRARRVGVTVRCSTRAACTGTVRVRVGNGSDKHPKRYRVAGGKTATIAVGLTPTAFRKIEGTRTQATVTLTEKGRKGERSVERRMPIRGRAARA